MKILLSDAGKRFNREWIFRHLHFEFTTDYAYAITGPNGSGKSTLLQCIGNMMQLSEGKMEYINGNKKEENERYYRYVSFSAPYMEVVEEMTLSEFLRFHNQFKPFIQGMHAKKIMEVVGLEHAAKKPINQFSSGMKQRVKLAQAFFSNTPLLLLDEPTTNLDARGIELYHSLIREYCNGKIVIICSNDVLEYSFCTKHIAINDYKNANADSRSVS
jgi:ABC-type multidrug transport system ATPase subunit